MSEKVAELQSKLRDSESKIRVAEAAASAAKKGRVQVSILSAIGAVLFVAIAGQWFPGYQLDSTAQRTSNEMAGAAVSDVMAQLCVARFMREPGVEARIAALNGETGNWSKANYIRNGVWASPPSGEKTDHETADKCRGLIAEQEGSKSADAKSS